MRYETFKFIIDNQKLFVYDRADATGTDNTTDPGAAQNVNPNNFLPPIIGGSKIMQALVMVLLVLGIIYLIRLNLK